MPGTRDRIRALRRRAAAAGHWNFVEVCTDVLEGYVLGVSRARVDEALATGRYTDELDEDLSPADLLRFQTAAAPDVR
jgi:hypothetical protein